MRVTGAIDWMIVATVAGPIIGAAVAIWLDRLLENRPRLVTYLSHTSAVRVTPPNQQPLQVHTHAIVLRNVGRKTATNVRLGHAILPDHTVYPAVAHTVNTLPGGGVELVFPSIVPGEQLTVSYLYFPPVIWNQINTYAKSDEGMARVLTVLPTPQLPRWVGLSIIVLAAIGLITFFYLLVQSIVHFVR